MLVSSNGSAASFQWRKYDAEIRRNNETISYKSAYPVLTIEKTVYFAAVG